MYVNLDPNYPEHPKTLRLIARLGPLADALPIRLWAYCAKIHPKDGRLKGYTIAEIESVIKWSGEPCKAVQALTEVGFLTKGRGGYQCVDWLQHQGHLEAFSIRGIRANSVRWQRVRDGIPVGVQKDIHKESIKGPPSVLPSVQALPSSNVAKAPKPQKHFEQPTPAQVSEYAKTIGFDLDGNRFCDYYEMRGWKLATGKPLVSWEAAVRTWKNNNSNNQQPRPQSNGEYPRILHGRTVNNQEEEFAENRRFTAARIAAQKAG